VKEIHFTRHKFLLVTVKEWLNSVLNYQSYPKNKTRCPFFGTPCSLCAAASRTASSDIHLGIFYPDIAAAENRRRFYLSEIVFYYLKLGCIEVKTCCRCCIYDGNNILPDCV